MNATDCGCCTTPGAAVPAPIVNRPGLSAIAYRIGTFATFRKAIADELARTPELAALSARVSEDYTLSAIELWAAVADVLTFYQERAANEAFLRTATLRDSVLRLVRLIGYELSPGAAATAQLAFTLDVGATALIPIGTRVKSVPGEGEKPQTYETLAAVAGDGRLNKLRLLPHPAPVSPTASGQAGAIVAPDAAALAAVLGLAPGDRVILTAPHAVEVLTLRSMTAHEEVVSLAWAAPIAGGDFATAFDAVDADHRAWRMARTFRLFGHDAPPSVVVAQQHTAGDLSTTFLTLASTDYSLHGDGTGATQLALDARYDGLKPGAVLLAVATPAGSTTAIPFTLAAVEQRVVTRNATPPTGAAVAALNGTVTCVTLSPMGSQALTDLLTAGGDIRNVIVHELVGAALRFWPYAYGPQLASRDVYLPGRRVGWSAVEVGRTIDKGAYKPGIVVALADFASGRPVLLTDANGAAPVAATLSAASLVGTELGLAPTTTDTNTIRLLGLDADQATPLTVAVSAPLAATLALSGTRHEIVVTIGALSAQTLALDPVLIGTGTREEVAGALQAALRAASGAATFASALAWVVADAIAVAAGVAGDAIAFAPSPDDTDTIAALGLDAAHLRYADGLLSAPLRHDTVALGTLRVTLGIAPPQEIVIYSDLTLGTEIAASDLEITLGVVWTHATADQQRMIVLPRQPLTEPRAFVHLALALDGALALDAASALLLGNVAPASHGESVRNEILGDGDAAPAFQRFTLKKKPLTYVPSATPGGIASTLAVAVNGVRWTEVPTFYGAHPTDAVYVTRRADDGTLTVRFGDGITGARPPSGRQNIVAGYRQGIGLAGRVGAGKLSTLIDRPTGVKSVTNLLAADGGADPQTLASARAAAPGTVRTFGRAVSLHDFEDTALMAGEVAKACATWVWTGERRAIHLTIAAQGGAAFSPDGLARIVATLATERDPNHKLLIANHAAVPVRIAASLLVDARYVNADVLAAARAALEFALAFEQRRYAEPVFLSDVYRVLQDVAGVVSVDIDLLDLKSTDAAFRAAHGIDDTLPQPQSRLLMLPARPGGPSAPVLPAELACLEMPAQDLSLSAHGGIAS